MGQSVKYCTSQGSLVWQNHISGSGFFDHPSGSLSSTLIPLYSTSSPLDIDTDTTVTCNWSPKQPLTLYLLNYFEETLYFCIFYHLDTVMIQEAKPFTMEDKGSSDLQSIPWLLMSWPLVIISSHGIHLVPSEYFGLNTRTVNSLSPKKNDCMTGCQDGTIFETKIVN